MANDPTPIATLAIQSGVTGTRDQTRLRCEMGGDRFTFKVRQGDQVIEFDQIAASELVEWLRLMEELADGAR